jgi:translin
MILYNIIFNDKFVSPEEIKIPSWIWLTSIADVIGELRRIILRNLINQEFGAAKKYYSILSELSAALRGQIFSKSLVPNLRRKIDIVRAITEKTESDIANASLKYNELLDEKEAN